MPAPERLAPYADIVADEVNVKRVILTEDVGAVADQALALVPAALGPRLGPETQRVIAAVKRGEWEHADDTVVVAGTRLEPGEYELGLHPRDGERGRTLPGGLGVVVLETEVSAELAAEGLARDAVREIQSARRDAGLHISDWVAVEVTGPTDAMAAVEANRAYVMEQTLAAELDTAAGDELGVRVTRVERPVP